MLFQSNSQTKSAVTAFCPIVALGAKISTALDYCDESEQLSVACDFLTEMLDDISIDDVTTQDVESGEYKREIIYSDPKSRFTVLLLSWGPKAETPVHGHRTWGAVGVIDGTVNCRCFEKHAYGDACCALIETDYITATSGMTAAVNPDPEGIHALYNNENKTATTVHIYGMDLSKDPSAINVQYQ